MKISAAFFGLAIADQEFLNAKDSVRSVGWQFLFGNAKSAKENTVVSPLSIVSALYMLASGSAGNAKTEIEAALNVTGNENYIEDYSYLLSALKNNPNSDFEEEENAQYTLEICNGAFYQTKFQDGDVAVFAEGLHSNFIDNVGDIRGLDFSSPVSATDEINSWVAEKTHGKISSIFDEPLDSNTLLVLANSLYYKAEWKSAFEKEKNEQIWLGEDGISNDVDFVYQTARFNHAKNICINNPCDARNDLRLNVVEIPMVGKQKNGKDTNHFTMNIWYIAPKQGQKMRKQKRISKANDDLVREIIHARSADYRQKIPDKEYLRLMIPKFSVSTSLDIKSQLMKIGIKQVFEGGADFSPIFGKMENLDVVVKSVNHKVQFDVDENGIEGSAATAMALAFRRS
ncbi:unnamed protein product, partial [Oikopleura dioica]